MNHNPESPPVFLAETDHGGLALFVGVGFGFIPKGNGGMLLSQFALNKKPVVDHVRASVLTIPPG